jgi:hypothetical protein
MYVARFAAAATLALTVSAAAQTGGDYALRYDKPQQVIKGLGFEIQSDSIGSGNAGMPDEVVAVPHDLTPSEKVRFYKEMLHGFRYARLAMGLYLRGLDANQKQIVERYPGQMDDLRAMQNISGIEGFDVEYWSPAPYWKKNKSYYGGEVGDPTHGTDPAFTTAFSDSLVTDLRYLQDHGLRIAQWGLQNEPVVGKSTLSSNGQPTTADALQHYATCYYSAADYLNVMQAAAPKVRALLPHVEIHANSWDGPAGPIAAELRKDPRVMANIDAWTWHQIGHNSNDQIALREKYLQGAGDKPVYENEFEYQPWSKNLQVDEYFMNTGQALMNWMVFENSPVWYWIHALKPVTNVEAVGYSLGFWRPPGEARPGLRPDIAPGHWDYNQRNWNAVAGFLRYLPWDSTRLSVDESSIQQDERILVWRDKQGHLGIALSNRGPVPYTFHLHGVQAQRLAGHRYTVSARDTPIGTRRTSKEFAVTVLPQTFEFWIAD